MGGALKHMMNRGLSKGWRGWEAMMTERREAMDLMRRGLSFMVNAQLVAAFNSWRGVDSGAQIAQRGLLHMLHRESLRGFRAWVQHFHTSRARGASRSVAVPKRELTESTASECSRFGSYSIAATHPRCSSRPPSCLLPSCRT